MPSRRRFSRGVRASGVHIWQIRSRSGHAPFHRRHPWFHNGAALPATYDMDWSGTDRARPTLVSDIMTNEYQLDEARVLQTGASIESGPFVFQGSLDAARRFLQRLPDDERASLSVWTPGHVFTVAELLSETPGAEHIPL